MRSPTCALLVAALLLAHQSQLRAANPTALTATVVGNSVAFSWQGEGTEWLLEAGSSPGLANLARQPLSSAAPQYTATGVPPGVYYVRVRAVVGGVPGPASNEVIVQVGGFTPTPPPSCIVAEYDLTSVKSGLQVELQWGRIGQAEGTRIEVGSAPGASDLASLDLPQAQSRFIGVGARGTYYIRVRGLRACGVGVPSNEVRIDLGTAGSCQATLTPFITPVSGPGLYAFTISVPAGCTWTTFTREPSILQPVTLTGSGTGTIQYRRLSSSGGFTQIYVTTSSGRYVHHSDCC